jgi:hypothetical protein
MTTTHETQGEPTVLGPTLAPDVSPTLYAGAVVLGTWLLVYGSRKLAPGAWVWLRDKLGDKADSLMGLPALLTGALLGAMANATDPLDAIKGAAQGAAMGLLSTIVHGTLKASPIPYTGDLGK